MWAGSCGRTFVEGRLGADLINANVRTLADLPFHIAGRYPSRAVLRRSRGDTFIDMSGRELFEQVRDLSLGLIELGLVEGDRVAAHG